MKKPVKFQSLSEFVDRTTYVVTELNGLISSIVNDEITLSDFDGDLTELFDWLKKVEGAVNGLTDLFFDPQAKEEKAE